MLMKFIFQRVVSSFEFQIFSSKISVDIEPTGIKTNAFAIPVLALHLHLVKKKKKNENVLRNFMLKPKLLILKKVVSN